MSVRSTLLMVVAVMSISAGALPLHAKSDLPFNWVRYLNSTDWTYTHVKDPSESGSNRLVERFELRMGDCNTNERKDDCNSNRERIELVEFDRPVIPLNGEVWYRWQMYFPENYENIYPAKTHHVRFVDNGERAAWSFEVGSTGVFWLGGFLSDEVNYHSLIDEDDLLSQWHEFSIHAKWGSDDGFFKVWVNNIGKVDYVGPTCWDCRIRLGYGIIRSGLERYYQSYPGNELPTQVIYYAGLEKSTSGVDYPGYIPPQKIDASKVTQQPTTLKPVLIIESDGRKTKNLREISEEKGDAEIPNQDRN